MTLKPRYVTPVLGLFRACKRNKWDLFLGSLASATHLTDYRAAEYDGQHGYEWARGNEPAEIPGISGLRDSPGRLANAARTKGG